LSANASAAELLLDQFGRATEREWLVGRGSKRLDEQGLSI
jgi:hypothetical protein